VEFFTKFFEGGGRKFQPFAIETRNLVFRGSATGK
jgi:vacuolar-type H+-ATPase subunit I/STV1